jgi:type I restriction enzyme R subunit
MPPPTNTSEAGLESLIVAQMTAKPNGSATESLSAIAADGQAAYGQCWIPSHSADYDKDYAVDLRQLRLFLEATQPRVAAELDLEHDSHRRRTFLARLQGAIAKEGTVYLLRKGLDDGPLHIDLYYPRPTPGNTAAAERYAANRFSVTRQLHFSKDNTKLSLDLCCFLNGLPIATFELKNSLTKQTVEDAVEQYKRDRDPKELLFQFGRCVVHFAVDDDQVRFCTELKGKASWFLPFNKGHHDGAGNPPNPQGLKTDYLWRQVLAPHSLSDLLENYAQVVKLTDPRTNKKKESQIWPRYHQFDVVRALLAHARDHGAGQRYLIQHSAGSGKSNSIAWLAHQLTGLEHNKQVLFDSIIVVTDRRNLDTQINQTIKQFMQVGSTVGHADRSGDLRSFITEGKKIIITTVQKFPFVLDEIGSDHAGRRFAIVIDEAHSSQGGRTAAAMAQALSGVDDDEEQDIEDRINALIEAKKLLPNASYFAFTATPKNKTLEIFGTPQTVDGQKKFRPFHSYTMKQAIQEGFIMDVLKFYTPVDSYYKLVKRVEDDPEFDSKRANKKLRRYVEGHEHAIRMKAEIMVDHFHEQVLAQNKVGGQARAMVVTNGIDRAIQYFQAFNAYLTERKSPYKAIVAFSGEKEVDGVKVTEAGMNGFPSSEIEARVEQDPYRFLIAADKFQTGYDQPLLHTMYVDKTLSGIKAVQTLSRLNRAHPKKHDVFVLDFMNDVDTIQAAFSEFYRTTILVGETDPNKLHDLKADLDRAEVYTEQNVEGFVLLYLSGVERDQLDPVLDMCRERYQQLDEDGQVDFKSKAKAFTRTYGFLSGVLPYAKPEWEKLSIFLNFLIPKLPAPVEEDLSRGILEAIDMDSYRVEKKAIQKITLPDAEAEIAPVPTAGGGRKPEPELERLSTILRSFNDAWGNIPWEDKDRIAERLTVEIPQKVAADTAYQNAIKNSDKQNARIEMDKALLRVMIGLMKDETELFKQFSDNEGFKRWLGDSVFRQTYVQGGAM